jgi:hypothetical protein
MVYKINHSIEFYVILNKSLNYFDIIPQLEQLTNRKLYLTNNKLKIISAQDSISRLHRSNYYLQNKENWDIYKRNECTFKKIPFNELEDILLDETEQEVITKIIENDIIKNNIKDIGWYEIIY